MWVVEYGIAKDEGRSGVSELDLGVALARHDLRRRESGELSLYEVAAG